MPRWIYTQGGVGLPEPIEISDDWTDTTGRGGHKSEHEVFGNLQAQDGADISTRKRHREYMKANGVTLADDYRETWKRNQAEKERTFTEGPSSKTRREAIERAWYHSTNRRGK